MTIKAYQSDGITPAGVGNVSMPANGHRARFVNELVGHLPDGFTGVLDVASQTPFAALTMRSLDNERNDFLLATMPIADMTRAAPSPIVFPQIADGAGGASDVSLNFYGQDGRPLPVGK